MNCKSACNITSEYVDHSLPQRMRSEYESHIHQCPECAGVLAETRDMVDALRSLGQRGAPVDCWTSIRARITRETPRKPAWRFLLRPVVAAPAAGACLLAAVLVLSGPMAEPPERGPASIPQFGQYISAHARLQRQQVFADPDVAFVAAEIERASMTSGSD